jgi:hypothetical protein
MRLRWRCTTTACWSMQRSLSLHWSRGSSFRRDWLGLKARRLRSPPTHSTAPRGARATQPFSFGRGVCRRERTRGPTRFACSRNSRLGGGSYRRQDSRSLVILPVSAARIFNISSSSTMQPEMIMVAPEMKIHALPLSSASSKNRPARNMAPASIQLMHRRSMLNPPVK